MADIKVMNNNLQAAASLPPVSKDKEKLSSPPPVAVAAPVLLFVVWVWALITAVFFAAADIAILILNRTPGPPTTGDPKPCKSTWLFRCVELTEAASAEMTFLLYGQLLCSLAVALAAPPHMLLATRTSTWTSRWTPAVVDALAWVALSSTAGMYYTQVASDRIFIAADPGDTCTFVDAVFASLSLAVTLLVASFLLCCSCSPRRLELGEDQGDDDGEV